MDKLTALFKILSDETRMRILILLYHQKLCVCQIQGILEESQPKISKHLGKLRDIGLVKDERKEQFIYYYLDNNNELLDVMLKTIILNTGENHIIQKDLEKVKNAAIYIK